MKLLKITEANTKVKFGKEVFEVSKNGILDLSDMNKEDKKLYSNVLIKSGWEKLGKNGKVEETKEIETPEVEAPKAEETEVEETEVEEKVEEIKESKPKNQPRFRRNKR